MTFILIAICGERYFATIFRITMIYEATKKVSQCSLYCTD